MEHVYIGAQPPSLMGDWPREGSETVEWMNEWMPQIWMDKAGTASIGVQRVNTEFCLFQYNSSCVMMSHFPTCPEWFLGSLYSEPGREGKVFSPARTQYTVMLLGEVQMMAQLFQWAHLCPFNSSRKCIDFLLPAFLCSSPLSFNYPYCLCVVSFAMEWATWFQELTHSSLYSKVTITVPVIVGTN